MIPQTINTYSNMSGFYRIREQITFQNQGVHTSPTYMAWHGRAHSSSNKNISMFNRTTVGHKEARAQQ